MFGRGSVATFYGWALQRAGQSVEFYVRPERLAGYGSSISLGFYDARSRPSGTLVSERFHVRLRADIPRDHDYDVIVVSVQSHQFERAVADLDGCVSGATVLVLSNVWADPEQAASHLPHDQLVWGSLRPAAALMRTGCSMVLSSKRCSSAPSEPIRPRESSRSSFPQVRCSDWSCSPGGVAAIRLRNADLGGPCRISLGW